MSHPQPRPGILNITPYVQGKSKAQGAGKLVKLSSNENPLGPSPRAVAAYTAHASLLHRYPDGGAAQLREAIGRVHSLPPEQIVCGTGSDELIGLLVHAFAGEGDEVLMSRHGFLMYKLYTQSNGASLVMAPEKNLRTDVDAMLAAVTPRTKIVFVANPNNPTGSYLPASELKRLHAALPAHVMLVVDAAYAEYAEEADYSSGEELVAASGNCVMLRTFSKIYGLPSLRLGWGYFPPGIADILNRVRGPFNVSGAALAAGLAAVEDTDYLAQAKAHNTQWRGWLAKELSALGLTVHPSIANFLLIEFPASGNTAEAANRFLLERGIIVRDMVAYGLPHCLRATIGTEGENAALLAALQAFLQPA